MIKAQISLRTNRWVHEYFVRRGIMQSPSILVDGLGLFQSEKRHAMTSELGGCLRSCYFFRFIGV